jgi:peptidoglycan/LPS O-acetylase OafA/YrhL
MKQSAPDIRHAVTPSPRVKSKSRADIQGLRALAVLAVIVDHMLHWPSGGFIGVDVFFVISGFMITNLMLRERANTGRISIMEFYKRRVKRLLPASVLTIAVTAAVGWVVFAKARAAETLWDAAAALFFSSNWRFAAAGTDYFQQDIPPSPLQHFWSLGVEEQFYFVWPFLLIAVFLMAGKGASTRRRATFAAVTMGALIVASFAWSTIESSAQPTWAYFSTLSRAWELGVGALLAVCAGVFYKLPSWLRPVLAWVGLTGIVYSMFIITPTSAFPAPWALLPVISTAVVIGANIGGDQKFLGILTNPASVYIGNVSFSLYLWHFPAIIFLEALLEPGQLTTYVAIIAAIILASLGSYHGIENRFRNRPWSFGSRKHGSRAPSAHLQNIGLGVLTVAAIALAAFAFVKNAPVDLPASATVKPAPSGTAAPLAKTSLQSSLDSALAASAWPKLTPAIDEVGTNSKATELAVPGCLNAEDLSVPAQCAFNEGAAKYAVVVGDSIGISWMPGVRAALEPAGYSVHGIGLSNCPFANVEVSIENDPETSTRCNEGHAAIYAQIKATSPDLVIVSDAVAGIVNLASGAKDAAAQDEWIAGLSDAISQVKAKGTRVVVLSPNPTGKPVTECYNNFAKPADCESSISEAWKQKSTADTAAAKRAGATYVDTSQWFCSADRCPIFAGGAPIRWDGMHLTEAYSKKMAPELKAVLLPA